jgi:hypothetical protein
LQLQAQRNQVTTRAARLGLGDGIGKEPCVTAPLTGSSNWCNNDRWYFEGAIFFFVIFCFSNMLLNFVFRKTTVLRFYWLTLATTVAASMQVRKESDFYYNRGDDKERQVFFQYLLVENGFSNFRIGRELYRKSFECENP